MNHGLAVCKMTLLIKDHKSWAINETPPNRSLMAGNKGDNTNMSEFLSIILEPIASENKDSLEINSTDGLLAQIEKMNEETSSLKEAGDEANNKTTWNDRDKADPQPWAKVGVGVNSPHEDDTIKLRNGSLVEDHNTKTEIDDEDIAFHIVEDQTTNEKTIHMNNDNYSNPMEDVSRDTKESRTKMIRRKMLEARLKRSQQKQKDAMICRKTTAKNQSKDNKSYFIKRSRQ